MKQILLITLVLFANLNIAQVIWPDNTAPCNTTLQACVDGIAFGEAIEIHTNTEIDESISSTAAISLVAVVGYQPVFAAGRSIEMAGSASTALTVTYSGLTFIKGRIAYSASGTTTNTTTLNISNNHIMDNSSNFESIRIHNFNNHTLNLEVEFNQINFNPPFTDLDRTGAIAVTSGSPSGGAFQLRDI